MAKPKQRPRAKPARQPAAASRAKPAATKAKARPAARKAKPAAKPTKPTAKPAAKGPAAKAQKAKARPAPKAKARPAPQAQKAKPRPAPQAQKAKPRPAPQAKARPAPQAKARPAPQAKPRPAPQAERRSAAPPPEPQPELTPAPQPEPTPATQLEPTPALQPEPTPAPQPEPTPAPHDVPAPTHVPAASSERAPAMPPPIPSRPSAAPAPVAARSASTTLSMPPLTVRPAATVPPRSGGDVVRIVDAADPIAALREFLDGIVGGASVQQGQIALGAAQLMLLPIAQEHRGGAEVKDILDLVLGRWSSFPERTGFHAQEFLRNAFAAVGDDRERIARLTALVPVDASPELRFNVACALAIAGDRDAMLRAIEAALAAGASPSEFRRDADFEAFLDDPHFEAVLDRATAPTIHVDVGPHLSSVRRSLDSAVKTLRELGEVARLEPPAPLEAVLAAERARKIQLPNDYRALLIICDGMTLWDHAFLGTVDYRNDTELARSARAFLEQAASAGATGIDDCVPLANWGQPNDWLLYDPHGRFRSGTPGYVLMLNTAECPLDGLSHALDRFERIARDVLGTN